MIISYYNLSGECIRSVWLAPMQLRPPVPNLDWRRSVVASINVVNRHWAWLVLGWAGRGVNLRAGKPSRYVTSHLGQLSLPSLRGR